MSVTAMSWAWKQPLDPTTKFILLALADHANDVDFTCWPSLNSLQKKTGFSRPTIWKAIDRLVELNVMKRVGLHANGSMLYEVQVGNDVTIGKDVTQVTTLTLVGNDVNKVGNVGNKVGNDVTPNHNNHHESSLTISPFVEVKTKNQEERKIALEVLAFLNKKAGRNFRDVPANITPIIARLKEGFTSAELHQVIAMKCREWINDPERAKYLSPDTLFNRTKFAKYAGQLIKPEPKP